MRNYCALADALAYIERNLCAPLDQRQIADAAFLSLSALQKLFRLALHTSVKVYIDRRRLTLAARDIQEGGLSLMDVAMKYQYNSPEVFSRAFARAWGASPSAYRERWRFAGLFPRKELNLEGEMDVPSKRVDLGELYDELRAKRGYVLCFDIQGLEEINGISPELGDAVILNCLGRIDEAAGEDMLLFRVGGDEFALVTGLMDQEAVRALGERILGRNGEPVVHRELSRPASMCACAVRLDGGAIRYAELFERLQRACDAGKRDRGVVAFADA